MGIHRICRISGVAAGVVAMVVFAACGDDPAADSDGGPMSPEELAAVLVTAEDLGEGWSVLEGPEASTGAEPGVVTDETREMLPRIEFCAEASEESTAAADAASALDWAAFRQLNLATETEMSQPSDPEPGTRQPPQHDLVFVQEFLISADATEVEETYDALASGIEACWGVVTTYPDGERGRSTALEVPAIGDDRVGSREVVLEPGPARRTAKWDIRNVLARDGEVLIGITIAEITTAKVEPVLDDAAIEEIITTISAKLP